MNRTELLPDRPGIPPMAPLPEAETIDVAALSRALAAGEVDLVCVIGPTASGKTRYAERFSRRIPGRCTGAWTSVPERISGSMEMFRIT